MKKLIIVLIAAVLSATGCTYIAPVIPPMGYAFESVTAPLDVVLGTIRVIDDGRD